MPKQGMNCIKIMQAEVLTNIWECKQQENQTIEISKQT